jgi:hypothetical protein
MIVIKDKQEAMRLTHGTHLVGTLDGITYNDMENSFGDPTFEPEDSGDGKVAYEWVFETEEQEIFTVYSWKVPEDYARHILGRKDEVQFHVGGKTYAGDFIEKLTKIIK